MEIKITKAYLKTNPNEIFVFGDNLKRIGTAGSAFLRTEPNSYGFITKKSPDNKDESFYNPDDYRGVFLKETAKLIDEILKNQDKTYLISKIGSGLANRFKIFELIIEPNLKKYLAHLNNVKFLY